MAEKDEKLALPMVTRRRFLGSSLAVAVGTFLGVPKAIAEKVPEPVKEKAYPLETSGSYATDVFYGEYVKVYTKNGVVFSINPEEIDG